ncbi:hypothetical protein ASPZODRAFT_65980, partial [Penicilliopsis zonata CBS 506.65]
AEDSTASDNDGGERPVRHKLKETSITSNPVETASRASSRGRKRSHDDSENEMRDDYSETSDYVGHRRKRSRDSKLDDDNDVTTPPDVEKARDINDSAGQILSPKKKRSRDQLDKDISAKTQENVTSKSNLGIQKDTAEGQPEKKRHRDNSQERISAQPKAISGAFSNASAVSPFGSFGSAKPETSQKEETLPDADRVTSPSAFASSSLAAFSGSEKSPFGSIGTSTASVFKSVSTASDKPAITGFAAAGGASPFATSGASSGFSGLGSGFAGFGGGFGAAAKQTGGGLTTFASPSGPGLLGGTSQAKSFGVPAEEESENEDNDEEGEAGAKGFEKETPDERFVEQQAVQTGEEEERTRFSCKAKLFSFSGKEWKERGLGTFKVNVKELHEAEGGSKTAARMIMRADGVLRVMLNTPIFKGMLVGDPKGDEPKSRQIHLASLEDGRSVPLLLRVKATPSPSRTASLLPQRARRHADFAEMDGSISEPADLEPESLKRKRESGTDVPVDALSGASGGSSSATAASTTTKAVPTKGSHDSCEANDEECRPGQKCSKKKKKQKEEGTGKSGRSRSRTATPKRTPSGPWPEPLKQLAITYKALNLVYTFCCTRKHFATTFENIKGAVQAQLRGRELTVEDIARVSVLVPRAVRFEYVDEASLEVMIAAEKDSRDWGGGGDKNRGEITTVLLFEFLDGDLKRQVQHPKTGEPTNPRRRMRDEDLKMPVFSQKQMLGLIEKRNAKFTDAIDAFLVQCEDEGLDPVEKLEREKDGFIPRPPRLDTPGNQTTVIAKPPREIPKERKSIAEIIAEIRQMEWYTAQIVPDGHRVFDAQPPVYGELAFQLSQNLVNALFNTKGITQLYSHQAEAINKLYEGHNVIVSTSTSSGKSLIYQIPMLHELEKDPESRGMYIFPTKALAQDQRRSMKNLLQFLSGLEDTLMETFDGDTPMESRNAIRDEARIIFTNPDMLHITILPQESSWRTFLKNLRFVVVDELHVYNGLFGSHVAFIMRRLRRICAAIGNRHVRFISCSATVANPEAHMKAIFGIEDVRLVDFDGSPSGRKEFICWNTPYKDPGDPTSGRGDSVAETARLVCQLILRGVRVIAFCRIRKMCEILLQAVRTEFDALGRPEVGKFVMGYRGGYSPQDRRRIEREMFDGKLMGIVATNALELGVDIGSLDAVVTLGFPYSISNLRQQSGRAGRRNNDSVSVLVGDSYPTDQHYMKNPDELFTKPNCELLVDLSNELILEGHVQCAAYEMPIRPDEDRVYFGGDALAALARSRLVPDALGFFHCHARFRPQPSRCVSIRDTEDEHFAVIDTTHERNVVLEEVEASRAFFTIYEGGIFLHQGQTFLVQELNPEGRFARVVRVHVDWSTMQRDYTDIDPIETEAIRTITCTDTSASDLPGGSCRAFFGVIQIHAVTYGFFKVDKRGRILDAVPVDNPPIDLFTKGMWVDVPRQALDILQSHRLNVAAAIHAAEHAILSLLPTFVLSSPGDVRTECKVAKKEIKAMQGNGSSSKDYNQDGVVPDLLPPSRQRPARLTFYDAKGGPCGSGIASKAFEFVDLLLRRALGRIESCACVAAGGCLECVCDERCKEANQVMSKAGAGVILKCLLGVHVDVELLPFGEGRDGELIGGLETVVPATEVPLKR